MKTCRPRLHHKPRFRYIPGECNSRNRPGRIRCEKGLLSATLQTTQILLIECRTREDQGILGFLMSLLRFDSILFGTWQVNPFFEAVTFDCIGSLLRFQWKYHPTLVAKDYC